MALVNDSGNDRSERMNAAVRPRMKNRMTGEVRLAARTSRVVAQAPQRWLGRLDRAFGQAGTPRVARGASYSLGSGRRFI